MAVDSTRGGVSLQRGPPASIVANSPAVSSEEESPTQGRAALRGAGAPSRRCTRAALEDEGRATGLIEEAEGVQVLERAALGPEAA